MALANNIRQALTRSIKYDINSTGTFFKLFEGVGSFGLSIYISENLYAYVTINGNNAYLKGSYGTSDNKLYIYKNNNIFYLKSDASIDLMSIYLDVYEGKIDNIYGTNENNIIGDSILSFKIDKNTYIQDLYLNNSLVNDGTTTLSSATINGDLNANDGITVNTDKFTVDRDGNLKLNNDQRVNEIITDISNNINNTSLPTSLAVYNHISNSLSGGLATAFASHLNIIEKKNINPDDTYYPILFNKGLSYYPIKIENNGVIIGYTTHSSIGGANISEIDGKIKYNDGTKDIITNIAHNLSYRFSIDTGNSIEKHIPYSVKSYLNFDSTNINISKNLKANGGINVNNGEFEVDTDGNTTIRGILKANNGIMTNDNFKVETNGTTTIKGDLSAGISTLSRTTISGGLTVNVDNGVAGINVNTDKFNVYYNGNTDIKGTLKVGGDTTLKGLTASSATINGALNAGATTLSSATITNILKANGGINVNFGKFKVDTDGNTTINGILNANNGISINNDVFKVETNKTTILGTLNAEKTNLSSATINKTLEVDGTTTLTGDLYANGGINFPSITGTTNKSKGLIWSGGTDGAEIYYRLLEDDKGYLILENKDDTNAGTRFLSSTGKTVDIVDGSISVSKDLSVSGNTTITGIFSANNGNLIADTSRTTINGNLTVNNGYIEITSDGRLKNIKQKISESLLNVVSNTPVYEYTYKNDKTNSQQIGIIAQDLERLLPEFKDSLVSITNDKDSGLSDKRSLHETKLVYILWKALQEETTKRQELEKKIDLILEKLK